MLETERWSPKMSCVLWLRYSLSLSKLLLETDPHWEVGEGRILNPTMLFRGEALGSDLDNMKSSGQGPHSGICSVDKKRNREIDIHTHMYTRMHVHTLTLDDALSSFLTALKKAKPNQRKTPSLDASPWLGSLEPEAQENFLFYFCKTYSVCGSVLLETDWIKTCRTHYYLSN